MLFQEYYKAPDEVTREEMQEIDRRAIEEVGIPSMVLMENAGRAIAGAALELYRSRSLDGITILAGPGNNGGDGLVAGRHLGNLSDRDVDVLFTGDPEKQDETSNAARNRSLLQHYDVAYRNVDPEQYEDWLPGEESSRLVVDALFGTGLDSDVRPPYREMISAINDRLFPVLSVDLPSGLDANTGRPLGISIESHLTVTFGAPKKGLVKERAIQYVGSLKIVDISLPRKLFD